ncbi:MAG: MFS transporter [Dehalococcoidia bacterium]|nr:MFS transporter [Dehalococcoidia bacterium]
MAVTADRGPAPPDAGEAGESRSPARPPWPGFYYGYWILGGAFVSQLITIAMMTSVVGPFVNPMTESLGWTTSQFFTATTVSRFVMSGVGFFIGASVDRHGGRRFMLAGGLILGLSLFLAGSVTELWQWIVLRGVMFTMGAALVGNLVVNVTMAKWWVTKRGRMIGFSSMGVSLAGMTFPGVATVLIAQFGWEDAWRVLALITVITILPTATIMRRQPEDHGWHPDGLDEAQMRAGGGAAAQADYDNSFTRREALHTKALYLIVLAFGLGGVGIQVMLVQSIPFLEDNGFSTGFGAVMATTMSFPALISKPFWGWTMERIEPKTAAAIGFGQAGVAMIVIVFAANADAVPLLVLGYALMGWGFGGQIPLQETIWGSYFGRRYLGSVRSVAMPISLVIGASSPLIVATYRDMVGNYNGVFVGVGVCWIVAALVVMLVRKPPRPDRPPPPPPPEPAEPAAPAG